MVLRPRATDTQLPESLNTQQTCTDAHPGVDANSGRCAPEQVPDGGPRWRRCTCSAPRGPLTPTNRSPAAATAGADDVRFAATRRPVQQHTCGASCVLKVALPSLTSDLRLLRRGPTPWEITCPSFISALSCNNGPRQYGLLVAGNIAGMVATPM